MYDPRDVRVAQDESEGKCYNGGGERKGGVGRERLFFEHRIC